MNGSPPCSPPSPAACPCEGSQDPRVVTNAPGLPALAYRVDDFTGFRRALLTALCGEQALSGWRPAEGDLGLQMLEWWAYLADVLTFYNERVANESYLRTAQSASSIAGLVALLGYTPAPGLAATGQLGAIRTTTRPSEPLVIPQGMQVSSTATPGVPAQIFEVAPGASFPGPSDVTATLPPSDVLETASGNPASVLLAGKVTAAKAGDRLVLVAEGWDGSDDQWSLVTVAGVTPETDPNSGAVNTRVSFGASAVWGTAQPPVPTLASRLGVVYAGLIDTARVDEVLVDERQAVGGEVGGSTFGGSALAGDARLTGTILGELGGLGWVKGRLPPPAPVAGPATGYRLLRPTAAASLLSLSESGASPATPVGDSGTSVGLSAAVRAIQPGDLVLFDGGTRAATVLAQVTSVSESLATIPFPPPAASPPRPDIIVTHSVLGVSSNDPTTVEGYNAVATTIAVRYALKDVGTVLANPVGSFAALPQLVFVPGSFSLPLGVTTALLQDANGVGALVAVAPAPATAAAAAELPAGMAALELSAPPAGSTPSSFDPPLVTPLRLVIDVVGVSRGVTVAGETLGSGNAQVPNQRFTLQKSPLTYLASGTGWTSTLSVYVDGVAWSEVPTLYGQAPAAQVYVVERALDQSATVRFGDGVTGARPASGNGNITATYRYGSGAASPPAGRLTTIVRQQANLAAILNPIAVNGGEDPPSPADVKSDAPASVFTFGRAISALDYEVVASQAAGVSRAKAYWSFDAAAQRNSVVVYVDNDAGGLASAIAALAGAEDPNRPVSVQAATEIDLSLACTLFVAADRDLETVLAAATASVADPVSGAFSPSSMGIGQWLYRSYVDLALSVAGVVAVRQLEVSWPSGSLANVADPGEGAYFALPAANVSIVAVVSSD